VNGSIAATMRNQLDTVVRTSTEWLCAGSNAAQVETLGYNTDSVLECLGDAAAVIGAVQRAQHNSNTIPDSLVLQLRHRLFAVGQVLASFAHPGACNNPGCMTFFGPSESSLVHGSGSKCSSCRTARYCSKSCQRAAWIQHKHVCKALAAAAAAVAASGKRDGTN
jgi:hypothetical protein